MINRDNLNGLLAVLAGMLIFKATTYIDKVETIIKDYPIPVIGAAFILFFYRHKITEKVTGRKKS